MWKKQMKYLMVYSLLALPCVMQAQDDVTNAFDDLRRQGTVDEQDSEMRRAASPDAVKKLMQEKPEAGYFCFTEDRLHDIRMTDALPVRWVERSADSRTKFRGDCFPGEFYTWQVGIFAPYQPVSNLSVTFSDWKNEKGNKIPASAFRCFNLGGTDTDGKSFKKTVNVPKGNVQALWIGSDVPVTADGVYKGKVTIKAAYAKPVVHHVGFFAQDTDGGFPDLFAYHLVLCEGYVDVVRFRVPFAVFRQPQQAGYGVEQPGVGLPSVHQHTGTDALEEGDNMCDGFGAQPGVFGTHFFVDFVDVGIAGRFQQKDPVFRVGCHRIGCHPDFQCICHNLFFCGTAFFYSAPVNTSVISVIRTHTNSYATPGLEVA